MSEIKKPGDSQAVRTQVWDPVEPQGRMLSEAVSLGMKKVRNLLLFIRGANVPRAPS